MENELKQMELIESYLQDKLSPEMANDFVKKITADPNLKSEVEFQRDIVESVKVARKAELKARLNRINVTGTSSSSQTGSVLTASAFFIALGLGIYFISSPEPISQEITILQSDQKPKNESNILTNEDDKELAEITTQDDEPTIITNTDSAQSKVAAPELIAQKQVDKDRTDPVKSSSSNDVSDKDYKDQASNDIAIVEKPMVVIPDITSDFVDDDELESTEELDVTDNSISMKDESTIAKFEIENLKDDKYTFNYRFKKGKLLLYGNFSASPYEIIELNTNEGKRIYLYYSDEFYPLNEEQSKIADLTAITEKSLIQELNKIKNGN